MRFTVILALCIMNASFPSMTFAGREANEVDLPILADRTGIDHPDLPLKQLAAALTSHPHARTFRTGYATMEAMNGLLLLVRYDRKLKVMHFTYRIEQQGEGRTQTYWEITNVTEAAIGQAAKVTPDGFSHNQAYFDTLTKYGGKYHALRQ